MQYETNARSVLKAVSWRTWATVTTAVLVFVFTGEFALAVTVGLLEVFAKMALYVFHEKLWQRIRFGCREIPSFVVWITGLPASGKREIADAVYRQLTRESLKAERLDSRDVRPLFPETGFTPEEVHSHVTRSGHLAAMLEKNGVIVVASFVSPYRHSREIARGMAKNFIEVYLKTTPEACEKRDTQGQYARARKGEYRFFPGVHVPHEAPLDPEITIEVDRLSTEEASAEIVDYIRRQIIDAKKSLPGLASRRVGQGEAA